MADDEGPRTGDGARRAAQDADPSWTEIPESRPAGGQEPAGPSAYHFVPPPPAPPAPAYYPPPPAYAYPPSQPQPYAAQPYPQTPYPQAPYIPPPPYPPQAYYAPGYAPYYAPGYAPDFHQSYYAPRANPLPARIGGAVCMGCGVLALVVLIVQGPLNWEWPILCIALEVIASLLAIFGGLNAYQTRHYGFAVLGAVATMALAGSTVGFGFFLGLVALILVASSRDAFPVRQASPFYGWGQRWP